MYTNSSHGREVYISDLTEHTTSLIEIWLKSLCSTLRLNDTKINIYCSFFTKRGPFTFRGQIGFLILSFDCGTKRFRFRKTMLSPPVYLFGRDLPKHYKAIRVSSTRYLWTTYLQRTDVKEISKLLKDSRRSV